MLLGVKKFKKCNLTLPTPPPTIKHRRASRISPFLKQPTVSGYNRGISTDAACSDSPITYNVTLRGGVHAGI